jgi:hypothetical protein
VILKKLAEIGFQEGIGFIPFAGLGWKAFKTIRKGDPSPARAAAATILADDPEPRTTEALANATGDKNWIIRAAALEPLPKELTHRFSVRWNCTYPIRKER